MTIKAVFRVQCDGPCKGWLSDAGEVAAAYGSHTVRVTALFPGERAARTVALNNGWKVTGLSRNPLKWLCPTCKLNPLDIRIPHDRLGARCIVTGRYVSGNKVPYSSIDVPVDLYRDTQIRRRVERDVAEHFKGHTAGTDVTDIETFWVWMPEGDLILELDPDDEPDDEPDETRGGVTDERAPETP